MMEPTTSHFEFEGHRLVYDEYGAGRRVVVLLPGLLFSRKMHRPLAETLADVLAWEQYREQPHGAGLTDDEERELIRAATAS